MAILQISIIPMGTKTTSVSDYIADVQDFLRERGTPHELHDMGTIIYGNTQDLFALAAQLHELPFVKGSSRVVTNIVVDDRRDKERGPGEKKASVLRILSARDNEK
ncbi:MAG: thiamine-binding protein [Desulfobulbus sp.]|nr:MAG: thiamine-binding protein [Desulfobulbus sp.]